MADLDDRTNEEFEKRREKGSELEEKTEAGFFATLKKFSMWDWAKIAGTSAIGIAYGGISLYGALLNWGTTVFSYLLAHKLVKKNKIKKSELQAEFHLASLMTPVLYRFFYGLAAISNPIYKSLAGIFIAWPPFVAVMTGMKYVLNKYTPMSFIKDTFKGKTLALPYNIYKEEWKPNYWNTLKNMYKYLSIPFIITLNYVIPFFQIAAFAGVRTLFRYLVGKAEEEKKPEKSPEPSYKPAGAH